MKGRVYDPLGGRFMTADPVMQAPFWSQGLNRYSYVFNNPINNTDPSGFDATDSGIGIMGWGAGATGIAALQGFSVSAGAILGGVGIGALNPATSLLTGQYSQFDGSAASTQSGRPPTTAPKGGMGGQGTASGASTENKWDVGAARRPPSACDVGMCLALSTPGGVGAPGYEIRNDGTGGGVPVEQRSAILDEIISFVGREVATAINIIISLEQHRRAFLMVASPAISVGEIAGKTPDEIDKIARSKGLVPRGPNPKAGAGSYVDPVTGKQRVLVDPDGASPHAHVNNPSGQRLGPDNAVVEPESPEAHLPIKL